MCRYTIVNMKDRVEVGGSTLPDCRYSRLLVSFYSARLRILSVFGNNVSIHCVLLGSLCVDPGFICEH